MKYKLQPDTPRPLSRCGAYVAPGRDARWRDEEEPMAISSKTGRSLNMAGHKVKQ